MPNLLIDEERRADRRAAKLRMIRRLKRTPGAYERYKARRYAEFTAWRKAHPERFRALVRRCSQRLSAELRPSFIRKRLRRRLVRTGAAPKSLRAKDIPEALVKAETARLRLVRQIRINVKRIKTRKYA